MSRPRLYFDVDAMQRTVVSGLRARGLDVETALDAGMLESSDEEHLEHASAAGRVLYTFNTSDFFRIHSDWMATGRSHAGLVLAPQQRFSAGEQIRRILKLTATRTASEMMNAVEFLTDWGATT